MNTSAFLLLKGCRQHNLKNISLKIPKNCLIAITGVSGSGKSSLAFDTLFAEGQRRYLEYLSPEARSLIKQMPKPEADLIEGLSPTLAIGQGKQTLSTRGTVATYTDIYDFLALLYTTIGEQYSPTTGKRLLRYSRQEIVDLILREYLKGTKIQLIAPITLNQESPQDAIIRLQQMGFVRIRMGGQEWDGEGLPPDVHPNLSEIEVVIDRLEIKDDIRDRLSSSVETAMDLSRGILKIQEGREGNIRFLTEVYLCPETSISFAPLGTSDFNFNSPKGACPVCKGLGGQEKIDPLLLFEDPDTSLANQLEEVLQALPRSLSRHVQNLLNAFFQILSINEEAPIKEIPSSQIEQLIYGSSHELSIQSTVGEELKQIKTQWKGLIPLLEEALQDKKSKGRLNTLNCVQWQLCPACHGARLKPESLSCLIQGKGIHQLCAMTVSDLLSTINAWHLSVKQVDIANEIIPHIQSRLSFLNEAGLGYLELNREGKTLSDGEIQRVQLASQIGAKLSGILYILDEPSLGLHRQDIRNLHKIICQMVSLGNTVIVVEHEKSLISSADQIIELGPGAGIHGGNLIFQGSYETMLKDSSSITGPWLSGQKSFPKRPKHKTKGSKLQVHHASMHNIQDLSLSIPLGCIVGFCGVSGSGKSTLVKDIIGDQIQKVLRHHHHSPWIEGYDSIKRLVISEKRRESSSSRSIPATYVDLMTPLRHLFSETKLAKARGYTPSRFSLNKRGGRCEVCEGLGQVRVSMQFMPDLFLQCEVCQGLRYNYETLQVTWENRNIAEVLDLSVEEAARAFKNIPNLSSKLQLMNELGLDYLTLGQHFNTLSAGEIQRLRLVADLAVQSTESTLYILDEPSAGLHFEDIAKLVRILHKLIERGHSIFVVEHHLDILKQADWLIEIGPGGGPKGGQIIFQGSPEKLSSADTPTGRILGQGA